MNEAQQPGILADHELIRQISAGSYGEVWLAKNALGAYRAIKIIQRTRFDTARPFQREFEGIQKFEPVSRGHEGLVQVLHVGYGASDDSFFYVMELADDVETGPRIHPDVYQPRTLSAERKRRGPLPVGECIQIGIRLCESLTFLHTCGLIHRDVKPSNVVYIGNQPKLADIGLVAGIGEAKTMVGTVGFIAPEGPNSPQADIYSLGKLLYEISTGQDRTEFPVLPLRSEYDEEFLELNEVLVKACLPDRSQRYPNAQAMASDLRLITAGKSVRRLHYLETQLRRLRKRGAVAMASVLALGAIYYEANEIWSRAREIEAMRIGSRIGQGTVLLQQGDLTGALPFFAEAARLDGGNKNAAESHRLRLGSILAASPSVRQVARLSDEPIRSCAIHGQWVLACVERRYVQVFDAASGQPRSSRLCDGAQPYTASFIPDDGLVLAANYDDTATLIDWRTGEVVLTVPHPCAVLAASAARGEMVFVTGCVDGTVFLCDRRSGKSSLLGRHAGPILAARVSPSGKLAVTTSWDATARVWDLEDRRERFQFRDTSWIYSADFSPDEHVLATAGYNREVRLWDLGSGKEMEPSLHHDGPVSSVRFSPDGGLILTASFDKTARLWSPKTHRQIERNHTLKHKGKLYDACFVGNGRQILTAASDGVLALWDFSRLPLRPQRIETKAADPSVWPIRSLDGSWEARTNGVGLIVSNLNNPARVIELSWKTQIGPVKFDSSSSFLFVSEGTNAHLVDLPRKRIHVLPHPEPVTFAQFSPDGATLVCASRDSTLKDMSARLWDVRTGAPLGGPLNHGDGVLYAGFSPDSRRVVTTSEDATAVVWDARSGIPLTPPMRHRDKVRWAAFARTKPWLATACDDGTALVWDSTTGDPLTPGFDHEAALVNAEFADGDSSLVTTDKNGQQWKWSLSVDAGPLEEIEAAAELLSGGG